MHNGEIIELIIRRDRMNISELSRKLNVSRKSIYNWFKQEHLSIEIITKLGNLLHHDFVYDFPEKYEELHHHLTNAKEAAEHVNGTDVNSAEYWRNKYIKLLEIYTGMLIKKQEM
nr:helix-turn-helix domain-containing protein [Pedobacter sp. ASV19]